MSDIENVRRMVSNMNTIADFVGQNGKFIGDKFEIDMQTFSDIIREHSAIKNKFITALNSIEYVERGDELILECDWSKIEEAQQALSGGNDGR